jgi:hypothetical protein
MSAAGGEPALRKHLLVMRAALERAEFAESVEQVRRGLRWTSLLKDTLPGFAVKQGLPLLAALMRRYPFVSTAASFLVSRLKPRATVTGVLRVIVVAGLVWQGWQVSRSLREGARRRTARAKRAERI